MRRWVIALVAAAVLGLAWTGVEAVLRGPRPEARDFQRLAGGLGLGASDALYWDYAAFDPRLEPDCTCALWPVPGGFLYSPEHRATAWDPPENLWFLARPGPGPDGSAR